MKHLNYFNEAIGKPRPVRGPKEQRPIGTPRKIGSKENDRFLVELFNEDSPYNFDPAALRNTPIPSKDEVLEFMSEIGIVIIDENPGKYSTLWLVESDREKNNLLLDKYGEFLSIQVSGSYRKMDESMSREDADLKFDRNEVSKILISELSDMIPKALETYKNDIISEYKNLISKLDDEYLKVAHYLNQLTDDEMDEVMDDIDMESYLADSSDFAYSINEIKNKYLKKLSQK